ncbi:metallophosphoesterase [Candidatus Babeliales bacterium]|nr:metallophosphoesterase [Candidatus Babeliales bacterium]
MIKNVILSIFVINFLTFLIIASDKSDWLFVENNNQSDWLLVENNNQDRAQPVPFLVQSVPFRAQSVSYKGTAFPTLKKWSEACKNGNKKNRDGAEAGSDSGFKSLGTKEQQWQEFRAVLLDWMQMMINGPLADVFLWEQSNNVTRKPNDEFYDLLEESPTFMPYAQKIIAKPGDTFFIRGDLHGDIFSLLAQLEKMKNDHVLDDNFRIIPDNVSILFLGDYVDRGAYGCEVLYTMLRLSLANPDRVVFVRGNHEDIPISTKYGFKEEVLNKFDDDIDDRNKYKFISRMNDLLPVVLYIGCENQQALNFVTNYLQCCHGGLEIGYNPQRFLDNHATAFQLLGLLHQKSFVDNFIKNCDKKVSGTFKWVKGFVVSNEFTKMKEWWEKSWENVRHFFKDNRLLDSPVSGSLPLGFMWNDFEVENKFPVTYNGIRGLSYGKELTEKVLELQSSDKSKIFGVFRAHQHGDPDMMDALKNNSGVYKLWNHDENIVARDCSDMTHCRTLIGGSVWTFNVGADSIYGNNFSFNFDAYGRLIVQQQLKDWKLQVFNTTVYP